MREKSVKTVNVIGLVGKILSIIAIVFTGLGMSGVLIATIAMHILPKSFLDVRINTGIKAIVDMSGFGDEVVNALNSDEFAEGLENGASFNGNDISMASVRVEGSKLYVDGETEITEINVRNIRIVLWLAVFSMAMAIVICVFVPRLSEAFRVCSTPFCNLVISRMNQLAICLIPWAIVTWIAEKVATSLMSNSVNLGVNVNFAFIGAVILLFGLVQIFKYGAVLQQEADETL